ERVLNFSILSLENQSEKVDRTPSGVRII
ncbi:hypothetical protein Trydic_g17754, partial [Trypoxylus dichotomus]